MKPIILKPNFLKPIILWSFVVVGTCAGAAAANCTTDPIVTGTALDTLINGKLVCGSPGAAYPGGASSDRWQEEHLSSHQLWDYKLGPANAVDPRAQVGTWSIANDKVTHTYTDGTAFTWDVRQSPMSRDMFSFCVGAAEQVRAVIVANGGAGCGGMFP